MEVIQVIATKSRSGKTTTLEVLIKGLQEKGYKVASIKHIPVENFSIDKEGSDTWKLSRAGSVVVAGVSNNQITYFQHPTDKISLEKAIEGISGLEKDLDYILVEGFKNEKFPRIIAAGSQEDVKELMTSETIAIACQEPCPIEEQGIPVIDPKKDPGKLIALMESPQGKLKRIRGGLPGLDCGDCGLKDCDKMAAGILEGRKSFSDCVVMEAGNEVVVSVGGKEVPLGGFVQDFVKNTFMGMIKTLKKVDIQEGDMVEIRIKAGKDRHDKR